MPPTRRFWKSTFYVIASVALLAALAFSPHLQAQIASSYLQIVNTNVEDFPNVSVTIFGEGLADGLEAVEIELQEDGRPQDIIGNQVEEIGVQIALVIDASSNIVQRGQTGKTRLEEVAGAVNDLTQSTRLLDGKDYLSAISFGRENNEAIPQVLAPWSIDHQGVLNQVVAMQPDPANVRTPLIQQIFFALEQFNDDNVPRNLQRHVVVFSDGVDLLSGTQPEDLPRIATLLNVRIHTVWFSNGGAGAEANMKRIAQLTGGQFFAFAAGTEIPTNIWETIQATQRQRVMSYRSSNPNPQRLTISADSATGSRLRTEATFPAVRVLPVQVRVIKPDSTAVTRSGPQWDTLVTALTPSTLAGQIEIGWPDGRSRAITSLEYLIDGRTLEGVETQVDGSTLNVVLPIANLDAGPHTLRVRAVDELGLLGESAPINFNVIVNKPAPPPAPNAQATATSMAVTRQADQNAAATREANIQATADARATETQGTAEAVAVAMQATADANAAEIKATADARSTAQAVEMAIAQATADAKIAEQATANAIAQSTADARATQAAIDKANAESTAAAQAVEIAAGGETVRQLSYVSMFSTALGLAALIFAVVAWRNPRVRKRATEIVTGAFEAVTEPFFGARGGGPPTNTATARLVLVSGDPAMNQVIELYKEVTKIGRDKALVDAVINDRRISRYHGQIRIERGGGFRLLDEGSTSGTWVNDRQLDMNGHMLQNGDEINFGPIRYRFELIQTAYAESIGGKTEPYVPAVGRSTTQGMDNATQIAAPYGQGNFDSSTQVDMSNFSQSDMDSTQYMVPDSDDDSKENRLPYN